MTFTLIDRENEVKLRKDRNIDPSSRRQERSREKKQMKSMVNIKPNKSCYTKINSVFTPVDEPSQLYHLGSLNTIR